MAFEKRAFPGRKLPQLKCPDIFIHLLSEFARAKDKSPKTASHHSSIRIRMEFAPGRRTNSRLDDADIASAFLFRVIPLRLLSWASEVNCSFEDILYDRWKYVVEGWTLSL
jgi:hypothetical protein